MIRYTFWANSVKGLSADQVVVAVSYAAALEFIKAYIVAGHFK